MALVLGLTACTSIGALEPTPTAPIPTTTITPAVTTTVAPVAVDPQAAVPPPVVVATTIADLDGEDPIPAQLVEHELYPIATLPAAFEYPLVIRVKPLPGTLALTFDDGPDPKWTPIILDILKERGVPATFFVLGWKVDAYPEIARRIVDEGHSLQSHAYRHHNLTNRSDAAVGALIDDTAGAIFDATGTIPVCLRPPQGITNSRLVENAAEHGHRIVLWTSEGNSLDYSLGTSAGVLNRARNWEAGYITLMHDLWGSLYQRSLNAILDDLDSRGIGYSTICVPDEIGPARPLQ